MGLLSGTTFHFHATAYGGVQIRFRVQRPDVIHFDDGSAALVSPFPDRLARIQRRKMFRASLITSANRCEATWLPEAQAKPLAFTVRDISVDGVGLRVGLAAPELPQRGEVLEGVQMNFGDLGRLVANLEVRNVYPVSGQPMIAPGADGRTRAAPRVADGRAAGQPPRRHLPEPGRAPGELAAAGGLAPGKGNRD